MDCLDAASLPSGENPSPIRSGDYIVFSATIPMVPLYVKTEDEMDEMGNVIGQATGIVTDQGFYVANRRLHAAYGIEFQAWQNGPVDLEAHDSTGLLQGYATATFHGPQGVRRFASAYLPKGIGLLGIFGGTSAIVEGHVLRICPLGPDLGPNPLWPNDGAMPLRPERDGSPRRSA